MSSELKHIGYLQYQCLICNKVIRGEFQAVKNHLKSKKCQEIKRASKLYDKWRNPDDFDSRLQPTLHDSNSHG